MLYNSFHYLHIHIFIYIYIIKYDFIPAPKALIREKNFAISILKAKYSDIRAPLNIHLISATPAP